jgi:hypothetical protein
VVAFEAGLERRDKPCIGCAPFGVFRDESDLSANPNLRGAIEAELLRLTCLTPREALPP